VRVLTGEVSAVDLTGRTMRPEAAGTVTVTPCDSLIVATGAGQSYFRHDEFARFAPGMKSIGNALETRARTFGAPSPRSGRCAWRVSPRGCCGWGCTPVLPR